MPSVSFDSLSFLLDGARSRASRVTVAAANFDATLVDPIAWEATLGELRHAGFNAVVIRVPWALHEPTPDRFVFNGACDLRRAIELAAAAGLKVMLRIGPCVGGTFARGGLPAWLRDTVGPRLREANGGAKVDVVLEMVGGPTFDASLRALARFGRLVTFGMASRQAATPVDPASLMVGSKSIVGFWLVDAMTPDRLPGMVVAPLQELVSMTASGRLVPLAGHSYPLADARQAHEDMRARRTTGKVILTP